MKGAILYSHSSTTSEKYQVHFFLKGHKTLKQFCCTFFQIFYDAVCSVDASLCAVLTFCTLFTHN